jgi:CRP-like cAMP-binding protein
LTNQDEASADDSVSWQSHKKIPAHKNVKSVGDRAERVLVICEGWAFRFAQLTDGRKQILSILIPGDVITPMRLFDDAIRFSVQALTDMRYCGYSRATLRAAADRRSCPAGCVGEASRRRAAAQYRSRGQSRRSIRR